MKYFSVKILIIVVFYIMRPLSASALEIGKSWEFNENGNTEGWSSSNELTVSNGTLKATVTSPTGISLVGPEFELAAREYGFIQIRMKKEGIERPLVYCWRGDSISFGMQSISIIPGNFYEYEDMLTNNSAWKGQVQQITTLRLQAPMGTDIEIDYIRIVSLGFRPQIKDFKPLRTILKHGEIFPLRAVVKNNGDGNGRMNSLLKLPAEFELIEGIENSEHGIMAPGETDTLKWIVRSNELGRYLIEFFLFTDIDTIETTLNAQIVNTYWIQDKFFLGAWCPPTQTKEAYDYYTAANFDQILTLNAGEAAVSYVESYNMRCLVNAGDLLNQYRYLRAPDNLTPETLTSDILANLDPMIEQFKDREAVWGYYLTDEPNAHAFENLGKAVAWLREKDPTRLSYINLFPGDANIAHLGTTTYDEYVERFLDTVKPELLSYDYYHFKNSADGGYYFDNLGMIRKWALKYNIPFCNIIQAVGTEADNREAPNWRSPTYGEHRWLVYSSLAYGARGIVWFLWEYPWGVTGSPKRDELYASIAKLNHEITVIGQVLLTLKNVGAYHTNATSFNLPIGALPLPENNLVKSVGEAELVVGFFKDNNNNDYIMFMNKDYSDSVTAAITLNSSVADLKVFDINTGEWQNVVYQNTTKGTVFECTLRPGGGKLFSIGISTSIDDISNIFTPNNYTLYQNYPNPFNPITSIVYTIAKSEHIILKIYDLLGREVKTIVDSEQQSGTHTVELDASDLSSGVYLYSLETCTFKKCRKMLLLK